MTLVDWAARPDPLPDDRDAIAQPRPSHRRRETSEDPQHPGAV